MIKYFFIILFIPSIVFAEIENARDLMEEGKFKEAMEELSCCKIWKCRC